MRRKAIAVLLYIFMITVLLSGCQKTFIEDSRSAQKTETSTVDSTKNIVETKDVDISDSNLEKDPSSTEQDNNENKETDTDINLIESETEEIGIVEISEKSFPDIKFREYISEEFDRNSDNTLIKVWN